MDKCAVAGDILREFAIKNWTRDSLSSEKLCGKLPNAAQDLLDGNSIAVVFASVQEYFGKVLARHTP